MDFAWSAPDRHSRVRGNPGLVTAELAWIPAFAGMTEELMERRNLRRFFTRREETLWAA